MKCVNVGPYLQFHSVKEPSKNRDIWVRVPFGSWQNLGSDSVRSCWVRALSHLLISPSSSSSSWRTCINVSFDFRRHSYTGGPIMRRCSSNDRRTHNAERTAAMRRSGGHAGERVNSASLCVCRPTLHASKSHTPYPPCPS